MPFEYILKLKEAASETRVTEAGKEPEASASSKKKHGPAQIIEKIVYISCCPETLSRDLKIFAKNGYKAVEAEPVDMFPWTSSIEVVCLLTKN